LGELGKTPAGAFTYRISCRNLLLYYITDRTQFPGNGTAQRRALLDKIAEAAACGVDFIQLREKDLPTRDLEILAQEAVETVREQAQPGNEKILRTRLLINSRVDVAIASGADGVHLRSDDISTGDARRIWARGARAPIDREGSSPIIAVSCHTAEEVARAASEGADFAVFAPVFEKKDMPNARAAGLAALRDACQKHIPVLALGGVNLGNARSCIESGAAGVAGIRLFQERDIAEVVRLLRS